MRKPAFAYAKTKTQISFAVAAKLISAFVFATRIVQSLFLLNPKFQASSHLLWLYSTVYVGPGRKPRRPGFSERGSITRGGNQTVFKTKKRIIMFLNQCFIMRPEKTGNIDFYDQEYANILHPKTTSLYMFM